MKSINAEELAQALFEEAGDALLLFDPDTEQICDANPMAQRLSGFSHADLLRMQISYLFRSEQPGGLQRLRQSSRKTAPFHSQDGFLLRTQREGVWVPVNVSLSRLHVEPRPLGLITARDVHEQREVHAQLARMEGELRRVLASVSDCLWSADVEGTGPLQYRYFSPVVQKLTGQPPEYFLGGPNRWAGIIHPDDRAQWEKALARLRTGQSNREEYRIVCPDGTVRWVSDSVMASWSAPADAAARSLKLDGVLTDVTERKRAEEALRSSEARLASIVETDDDGIILVTSDGRITFANGAAERILGLPRAELLRRTYGDPVWKMTTLKGKPLPEDSSPFLRVLRTGQPVHGMEQAIRRPSRTWVVVSINAAPLRDASGAVIGMVGSFSDITERRRAELAVRRRADEQEAVSEVSRLLLQIGSPQELFAELPQILAHLFEFEMVAIALLDERADELIIQGSAGIPHNGPALLRTPLAETLSQTVVITRKPLVLTDPRRFTERKNELLHRLQARTRACFPLIAGKRVIGTLLLGSARQKPLPPSLPGTLQTIADLIAQTLERKRTEEALRETNETLRTLIQAAPLAIYALDPNGRIQSWNPAAERMFGWTAAEILGRPSTLGPPDRMDEIRGLRARVLRGESFTGVETRRLRKDGTQIDVNLAEAPLYDVHGQVTGLMAIAADITERKRAEEALRERERRLQAIVNSEPECLTTVSLDGFLLEINPAGLAMVEAKAPEDILGMPVLDLIHPQDRKAFHQLHLSVCHGQAGSLRFRLVALRGGLRWLETHSVPLRGPRGEIVSVLSVARDITEQQRAEEALRHSEERFRALVENGSDAIALLNPEAVIVYASPSTTRILGYPLNEFMGRIAFGLLHPDDLPSTQALFARALAAPGVDIRGEFRLRHHDGSWRDIEAVGNNRLRDPSVEAVVINYRDITERKRAAAELAQERDLLQTIMENIPDPVFFKDTTGRFTRINRAHANYLGLSDPRQAVGKTDFDFYPEANAREYQADEQRILTTGQPLLNMVECQPGPDKAEHWILTTKVPVFGPDGKVTGLVGVSKDITESRRAEEALRLSEKRYRLLFERNLAGVCRATVDGRILDCNDSFARILGHTSRAEVLAHPDDDFYFDPEDRLAFIALLRQRHSLLNFENCLRRSDGSPVWVLQNVTLIDGEDCQRILEATVFDITERKRAEEALTQERALLRSLIDSIPDLIFYKNRESIFLGCNTAFEDFVGRKEHDLIDKTDLDLFPRETGLAYQAKDREVLAAGQPCRDEDWLNYPDGRRVLVETLRTPFFSPDGRILGLIGICRDITERKYLEGQLRQAQKMEAIGQLAGGVAHDFNNLLTAILGNVSLLLSNLSAADANREPLLATEKATLRAAELTRQLLGFSRQTMLRLESLNLSTAIEETIGIVGRTIDPRIQLELRLEPNLWMVQADPGQMNQVVLNLCLNARDAMPNGGRLILETSNIALGPDYAQLHIDVQPGEYVRLRVSDTGHGIPAEIRPRIFDPFFTTKGPGKGTGLGLAMVFGIVKQHRGWIDCYSEVNQGTRFDIYLPRSQSGERVAPPAPPPAPSGGNETILLVDDEAIIRNLGRTILQRLGYQVILAEDGRQAVEIYQREQGKIDLVILDLTMPNLSGRDAFRQLRQVDPAARVVFASGYSADYVSDVEQEGVLGFINKPYRPQDLAVTIRSVLDRPRTAGR